MNISGQLSQEKFREILINIYKKGEETETIQTMDLINEIKQQLLSILNTTSKKV